jgi:GPH family glycoside/pentoside/hexuronide:cation symporter
MVSGTPQETGSTDGQATVRLATSSLLAFAAPTLGIGLMFSIVAFYLMIFATDVLLIAPAAMGLIFGASRLWDAVSDPLVGFWSDRTRSLLGRRRPWLLASIPTIGLSFALMWTPPDTLSGGMLVLWMAVLVPTFYTAMTIFVVPHQSLGAEMSTDYHERSRVFAYRHVIWTAGSILALAFLQYLLDLDAPRRSAGTMGWGVAAVTGLLTLLAVVVLRERPENQGRGSDHPLHAMRDVWANHHARLLLLVFLIESLGGATIAILTPYIATYVVQRPDLTGAFILCYLIPSLVFTPIWLPLSRTFGKKQLWSTSMVAAGGAFGGMMFLEEGSVALISALAFLAGTAGGCGSIMSPSIQTDVIDFDEHRTGERKEGAYFAAWNFGYKSATGLTLMLTGLTLEWAGFVPNAVQNKATLDSMLALYALFPLVCFLIGALLCSRFSLGEQEHARIRADLRSRPHEG